MSRNPPTKRVACGKTIPWLGGFASLSFRRGAPPSFGSYDSSGGEFQVGTRASLPSSFPSSPSFFALFLFFRLLCLFRGFFLLFSRFFRLFSVFRGFFLLFSRARPALLCLLCLFSLLSCKKTPPPSPARPPSKALARRASSRPTSLPAHRVFASPAQALRHLLQQKPLVLGIGEYHQLHKYRHISSAIERFTRQMLATLRGTATDIVVETWQTTGQCGQPEKRVVRQVRKVSRRPRKTTNHIFQLLLSSKKIGLTPHILTIHCKTYSTLLRKDGKIHYARLLRFTANKLQQKARAILQYRARHKQPAAVVVYGGALHNDLHPERDDAPFSYASTLPSSLQKRYIELDLYVPEYVQEDPDLQKKPWFSLLRHKPYHNKTLLYTRSPRSFILLFPRSPQRPRSPRGPSLPRSPARRSAP